MSLRQFGTMPDADPVYRINLAAGGLSASIIS